MTSYRLPALAAAAFAIACGAASNPDVAAKVGSQQLSVTRLADIMGQSQAPLEPDVARSIAELWVNYQLLATAASKNDSLIDKKTMDDALWSSIQNMKVKKFYDTFHTTWDTVKIASDEERYNSGEKLGARHILVLTPETATPEQREVARKKAEAIRAEATPANFASLAARRTEEPGGKERGGELPLFGPQEMVPEFEKGVRDTKVGEISNVVQTSYGYHVIYRLPYSEVKEKFAADAQSRTGQIADSVYLASAEKNAEVKLESNAAVKAKAVAKNPLGFSKDNSVIAKYKGGELTASEFADWIGAYDPRAQVRPQIMNAPDSLVNKFVHQIVRNELMLRAADSTKMQADTAEMSNLYLNYKNAVTQTWTALGLEPSKLADSAKKGGDVATIAGARVETYIDKLIKNEVQFVDVPYPVARALQRKLTFSLNDAAFDKVVERAKAVRAAADSLRVNDTTKPPAGAPAAGAPPAGAPPAPPQP